jgi:hypothetical protein
VAAIAGIGSTTTSRATRVDNQRFQAGRMRRSSCASVYGPESLDALHKLGGLSFTTLNRVCCLEQSVDRAGPVNGRDRGRSPDTGPADSGRRAGGHTCEPRECRGVWGVRIGMHHEQRLSGRPHRRGLIAQLHRPDNRVGVTGLAIE